MNELVAKALRFINRRRIAYKMVFDGQHAETVLKDLAKFCRANDPCFHPDNRVHALMEGRREVWLRIQKHLNLTDEQLLSLYSRKEEND